MMNDDRVETAWARLRLREQFEEADYTCVVDRLDSGGNWHGEFHAEARDGGDALAAWVLKPAAAPYASLGLLLSLPPAHDLEEFSSRSSLAAEHDLAYCLRDEGGLVQLSTRLPVSSLEAEGIALHLRNLEAAQGSLLDLVHAEERIAAARRIELDFGSASESRS